MQLRVLMKPLVLGVAARAFLRHQRARRAASDAGARHADSFASDPGDPVQGFQEASELQGTPLEVDAQSIDDAEAAQDLAALESAVDGMIGDDDATRPMTDREALASPRDAGDLYGAHTPVAVDRNHLDDDRAAVQGQSWIEALATSAIEHGAEPEHELDGIVDDEDVLRPPHASSTRDIPIADYGSGGRSGQ